MTARCKAPWRLAIMRRAGSGREDRLRILPATAQPERGRKASKEVLQCRIRRPDGTDNLRKFV